MTLVLEKGAMHFVLIKGRLRPFTFFTTLFYNLMGIYCSIQASITHIQR